jgi:cytochrome P450
VATARLIPADTEFEVEIDHKSVWIDGLQVYPSQCLIHCNPAIQGSDAHSFMPERWLDTEYVAQLPPGHGPRNCIGQDLVIVEQIGLTGKNSEEVYDNVAVTSVPCDGMGMKVKKVG